MLPPLVSTGFQVLFHSPPGVLFTFPSRYYALSVTKSYLALEGGPPSFPQDRTCPAVLWYRLTPISFSTTGLSPSLACFSNTSSSKNMVACCRPATPKLRRDSVWAVPGSLAATTGIVITFFSSGYLDVSVPRVPPHTLCIHVWVTRHYPRRVSPFGHPRIKACLPLPVAYRSSLRPSSALGAKASALCSCSLDLCQSSLAQR